MKSLITIIIVTLSFITLSAAQNPDTEKRYIYRSLIQKDDKIILLGLKPWKKGDRIKNVIAIANEDIRVFNIGLQTSKMSLLYHSVSLASPINALSLNKENVLISTKLKFKNIDIWSDDIRLTKEQLYDICGFSYNKNESDKQLLKEMQNKRTMNLHMRQDK